MAEKIIRYRVKFLDKDNITEIYVRELPQNESGYYEETNFETVLIKLKKWNKALSQRENKYFIVSVLPDSEKEIILYYPEIYLSNVLVQGKINRIENSRLLKWLKSK